MKIFRNFKIGGSVLAIALASSFSAKAADQIPELTNVMVVEETTYNPVPCDTITNPRCVITNPFNYNWFVFASVGGHAFVGDSSNMGEFKGLLSPSFSVGAGKWFTPGIGLKFEYMISQSKGYTKLAGYGYGEEMKKGNTPYWKFKKDWMDFSLSVMFNLSHLINGYYCNNNWAQMNQFILSLGAGVTHCYKIDGPGSDNAISGHAELQYSRFFKPSKLVSLDIKLRAMLYDSHFDNEFGQDNFSDRKVDSNLGIAIGCTFYLGGSKYQGWQRAASELNFR